MNVRTLVALDFGADRSGNAPDLDRLRDRIGAALIDVATDEVPHWRTGEPQTRHLVRFDADELRDTHAHGIGCAAGFVCHLEH